MKNRRYHYSSKGAFTEESKPDLVTKSGSVYKRKKTWLSYKISGYIAQTRDKREWDNFEPTAPVANSRNFLWGVNYYIIKVSVGEFETGSVGFETGSVGSQIIFSTKWPLSSKM